MSEAGPDRRWGRGRPPWWPEDEPFPPKDWPRRHRRPAPRFFVFALVAFVIFAVLIASFVAVLVQVFTLVAGGPPHPVVIALGVIFLFFALTAGTRSARRIAAPVRDLIDAAERVERGDYSARVAPRGPRQVRSLVGAFNAMSARLERSEDERRRLLADVSHELRTPLTVMLGNVEALIDGLYAADRAHLETILEETKVLGRLVEDLRILSLAEVDALALHPEAVDVAALAKETAASFRAAADAAGVTLAAEGDAVMVDADPVRIHQVLANLVSNALRYTPRGGSVTTRVWSDAAAVTVSVRDTGPGVDAEVLPHLFERFRRSDESRGAGLGLAIAKTIVSAHGGTITAESAPGQGTEIRFTLPR